jgi:hypothetical protein
LRQSLVARAREFAAQHEVAAMTGHYLALYSSILGQ